MLEAGGSHVNIQNIDAVTLRGLVQLAYGRNLSVNDRNIRAVILAANYLQLHTLVQKCANFLFEELTDENNALCVQKLLTTLHISVATKADIFVKKKFSSITQSGEFLKLTYVDLVELLCANDIRVSSEEVVFHAAVRWVEHDAERMSWASRILAHVRFHLLDEAFLKDIVLPHPIVCRSRSCCDLVNRALECRLRPEISRSSGLSDLGPRHFHSCSVYITGGRSNLIEYHSEVLKYDPLLRRWKRMQHMITPRVYHAIAENDGKIYVVGGENETGALNKLECYDPITDEWTELAPMREARSRPTAIFRSGMLYVFGGAEGRFSYKRTSMEVYNPKSNRWKGCPPLREKRDYSFAALANGYIYVMGNTREDEFSAARFAPKLRRWESVPAMTRYRWYNGMTAADGKLYLYDDTYSMLGHRRCIEIHCYDPRTERWTSVASVSKAPRSLEYSPYDCYTNVTIGCVPIMPEIHLYNTEKKDWEILEHPLHKYWPGGSAGVILQH
ncbi:hypothetical protein Y032_0497g2508 [Ancylostoma ceylanicum]|nr:hypothetical protein Y032_0497g2508 [Ancylostoma ceylanicum]